MLALNGSGATNLNARKNLGAAQAQVAESIHRLSSGVRLHSAADDASGLAISALLLNQSQVVSGAQSNLGAATSMLQLADSSLAQANDALMRVKELVTQGSNDSLGQEQYLSIAQEIIQQLEEVQKLADRTSYNGNRVLGGAGNNLIDVQKTVSTVQNTTSIVGHPQGTWVSVDGSSAVGSLTGTLRVTITASAGTIRLTSSTNGVIIDDPASDAYNGNATSISLEGTRADILTALAKLEGQRTGAGDLNIAVAVNTVSSFTNGDFSNGLAGGQK
jgi:flagellin